MPKKKKSKLLKNGSQKPRMAKGQAQDQGRRVTTAGVSRGGKLGYKAIYNDFPDLVARAEGGDKQAKKQLRNGKYAFPHLRDIGKLPELKGKMLIDNFITALTTQPKHLYANYKDFENEKSMKYMAMLLQRAHRFTIDDDLIERVLFDSAGAEWEKIFSVINNAVPPFDNMWIETQRNSRHFDSMRNDLDKFAPEWEGWHIQRGGLIRQLKQGSVFPHSLIEPTRICQTEDDTIIVQKYMKPKELENVPEFFTNTANGRRALGYFIPKVCYMFTSKEHYKRSGIEIEEPYSVKEKSFMGFGEQWEEEINEFAPAHIRMNLQKRVTQNIGLGFTLENYNVMLGEAEHVWKNVSANAEMYEDDLRMLAWLFSELNFTWYESKPIGKPTRKNRVLIPSQASTDLKTIEIALPKPKGITLRPDTPSEGGHRKLHWVRGHTREYRDGRVIRIPPHQRGNAKYGEVIKNYALKLDKGEVDETPKDKD